MLEVSGLLSLRKQPLCLLRESLGEEIWEEVVLKKPNTWKDVPSLIPSERIPLEGSECPLFLDRHLEAE